MNTSFKKLMWITGASSGIGEAVAIEASKQSYKLALTARRQEVLIELKQRLVREGAQSEDIFLAAADVTNTSQLSSVYQNILSSMGEVDILFANAGSHVPGDGKTFNVKDYRSLFELNFFGVLNCLELVLPSMISRRSGHIVGVSSVAGYRALPTAAAYGASKSALSYCLESLRFDLQAHNLDVTVVSPGFVKTPLTDRNKFYMPCLIEASRAAEIILDGIKKKKFEIHFPLRFTLFLKLLKLLPSRLYHLIVSSTVKT